MFGCHIALLVNGATGQGVVLFSEIIRNPTGHSERINFAPVYACIGLIKETVNRFTVH